MKLNKVVIVAGLSILTVLMAANLAVGNEKEQQQPQASQVPQVPKTQKAEEDPNAAPLFALVASDGKDFKLSDFKGKIVVLEWFNYDCPFVRAMHQAVIPAKLMQKYNPNKVVWDIPTRPPSIRERDPRMTLEVDLPSPIPRPEASLQQTVDHGTVAVGLCTYKRLHYLKRTMHHVHEACVTWGSPVHLIVVDNDGADPRVREAVESYGSREGVCVHLGSRLSWASPQRAMPWSQRRTP